MSDSEKEKKTTQPSNTKAKWSLKKKILIGLGIVVAFIVAIILFANMATSAPLAVSDELVADIQATKSSEAYELLSSEAQETISSSDFATTIEQVGPILSGKPNMISKEVNTETGSDPTAKVVYEIKGSDNNTYTFTVNLTQNDGNWEVLNFESDKK